MTPTRRPDHPPGTMTLVRGECDRVLSPQATSDRRVLAVLFDHDADAWRRRWRNTTEWTPEREAYVDVHELARGAASTVGRSEAESAFAPNGVSPSTAPTTHFMNGGKVALTALSRPVYAAEIVSSTRRYVAGWGKEGHAPLVYIDDLSGFLVDDDVDGTVTALRALSETVSEAGATLYAYCDPDALPESTFDRLRSPFDAVVESEAVEEDLSATVDRFRREEPTKYGYLRQHWREAKRGIEASDRNYPQARQIHVAIDEPTTTPRTLGAALGALVQLGVIDRWGDTVSATRYDLTAYDADRLEAIGRIFESG